MPNDHRDLLELVNGLPPLPLVATRVMVLAQDPRTTAEELARVVATDQSLTAKLIRLSNSAAYAFGKPCASARDAVQLLGFLEVRQIAITASLMSIFAGSPDEDIMFDSDLFWGHSLTVAIAAEALARTTLAALPSDAFTAGILHDIGRLVIRQAMPEAFRTVGHVALAEGIPFHEAEQRVTGYSHELVGEALARRWSFPEPLCQAIAHHHDVGGAPGSRGLCGLVAHANQLVSDEGITSGYQAEPSTSDVEPTSAEAARLVGGMATILSRASWFMDKTLGRREMMPDRLVR